MSRSIPAYVYAFLYRPSDVLAGLDRAVRHGLVATPPNAWQLSLGVLRMWQRVIFRGDSVGTCPTGTPRRSLRARLLSVRALRLPVLLAERAVAPFDFTGLLSSRDRVIRHLLAAHHDGEKQFVYDLEILSAHPEGLETLAREVDEVVERDTPRSRWLRDLVIFEGYHEELRAAVHRALERGVTVPEIAKDDPDLSFAAYLRWCARQPPTPRATLAALRAGRFALPEGVRA